MAQIQNVVALEDHARARHRGADSQSASALDVVSRLFEHFGADASLPEPVRAELARLRIPTLRAAQVQRDFLSNASHPARISGGHRAGRAHLPRDPRGLPAFSARSPQPGGGSRFLPRSCLRRMRDLARRSSIPRRLLRLQGRLGRSSLCQTVLSRTGSGHGACQVHCRNVPVDEMRTCHCRARRSTAIS